MNTTVSRASLVFALQLLLAHGLVGQDIMYIHQSDGGKLVTPLTAIDSITYTSGVSTVPQQNPSLTYGSVMDVEGNTYATIVIGTQEWMAQNLRTTHFADGTPLVVAQSNTSWIDATSVGSYTCCSHIGLESLDSLYGICYQWWPLNSGPGVGSQGSGGWGGAPPICPTGWHIPTMAEWTTLLNHLGGDSLAGGAMKASGTGTWMAPNSLASNASGFSAVPSGSRRTEGMFEGFGSTASWWARDEESSAAPVVQLHHDSGSVEVLLHWYAYGHAIRCVKD